MNDIGDHYIGLFLALSLTLFIVTVVLSLLLVEDTKDLKTLSQFTCDSKNIEEFKKFNKSIHDKYCARED